MITLNTARTISAKLAEMVLLMEYGEMLDLTHLHLEDVKGVGTIELNLEPNKHAYVFIGKNGIGKTKLLETMGNLFTALYSIKFRNKSGQQFLAEDIIQSIQNFKVENEIIETDYGTDDGIVQYIEEEVTNFFIKIKYANGKENTLRISNFGVMENTTTNIPIITVKIFNRSNFSVENFDFAFLSNDEVRTVIKEPIRKWIIQNQNSDRLDHIMKCLNLIDSTYNSDKPEIIDNEFQPKIFIKVNGEKKELSELSSGFSSIFKIIVQVFSNLKELELKNDINSQKSIVLIDEIENHLHLEWQVKIIPLLKKLFPNTIFFIATHSPLVLSQLEDGEAYELRRDKDNVVRTHKIDNPSKVTIIDLLRQAFGIDLNQLKADQMSAVQQQEVKKALLELLD